VIRTEPSGATFMCAFSKPGSSVPLTRVGDIKLFPNTVCQSYASWGWLSAGLEIWGDGRDGEFVIARKCGVVWASGVW
jgi:hypothetical protein